MMPIRKYAFWLGLGFILISNLSILGMVFWNRSAEPESMLTLSERELYQSHTGEEDSSVKLSLVISHHFPTRAHIAPEKLSELGLDWPEKNSKPPHKAVHHTEKPVLVVLELDGPAYQQTVTARRKTLSDIQQKIEEQENLDPDESPKNALSRAQEALKSVLEGSRLYIVDIGTDKQALRNRYPDRRKYAIVRTMIDPVYSYYDKESKKFIDSSKASAYINNPNISVILPLQWHPQETFDHKTHFETDIAFGQRLEPWITRFQLTDGTPQ